LHAERCRKKTKPKRKVKAKSRKNPASKGRKPPGKKRSREKIDVLGKSQQRDFKLEKDLGGKSCKKKRGKKIGRKTRKDKDELQGKY